MLISIGVLFYPNQEGDVVDIQADIIGPGKLHQTISSFWIQLIKHVSKL